MKKRKKVRDGKEEFYELFFYRIWMSDKAVQAASKEAQGIWINILCNMWDDDEKSGMMSMPVENWLDLLGVTAEKFEAFLVQNDICKFADVTNRNAEYNTEIQKNNGFVTIINRKMNKPYKLRKSNANRQEKHRGNQTGNADVTDVSQDKNKSKNKSKEKIYKKDEGSGKEPSTPDLSHLENMTPEYEGATNVALNAIITAWNNTFARALDRDPVLHHQLQGFYSEADELWAEHPDRKYWEELFTKAVHVPFMVQGVNDWKPDLRWLFQWNSKTKCRNMQRLIDGEWPSKSELGKGSKPVQSPADTITSDLLEHELIFLQSKTPTREEMGSKIFTTKDKKLLLNTALALRERWGAEHLNGLKPGDLKEVVKAQLERSQDRSREE